VSLPSTEKNQRTAPRDVLDAAAACFMERGYAGATIDDVARHLGATKGRIYHYFGSKSELLHAVRKRAMDLNFATIRPGFDSGLAPRARFLAMASAHALNMIERQAYQRALLDSLHSHVTQAKGSPQDAFHDEFIADRRAFDDMFRVVLAEGQASGDFSFKTLSYTLHTVLTILNGSVSWYTPRPDDTRQDRQALADELVEMALRALGASCSLTTKGN